MQRKRLQIEMIAVNDGSREDTAEIASPAGIRVLRSARAAKDSRCGVGSWKLGASWFCSLMLIFRSHR